MDSTTTRRNMQISDVDIWQHSQMAMVYSSRTSAWHHTPHLSQKQTPCSWSLSAKANRQTVSMLLSSPDITVILVVTSVANWLPHDSSAGRIVFAALVMTMSAFQGKLHSVVQLEE